MAAANPKRRKKKRHPNWPVRLILLAVFLSLVIYVFLIPVFRYRYSDGFDQQRSHYLTYFVLTHAMTWFLTAWVFFFGACLGSFLNVVAYRIPSGLTILGSSRCPFCFVVHRKTLATYSFFPKFHAHNYYYTLWHEAVCLIALLTTAIL